jgi:hypothetical protein
MTDLSPEERRLLNHWNARRHAWASFQTSSRNAAERIARTADTDPDTAPRAVTDQAGSQHDKGNSMSRCPHCFSADGHHVNCPQFVTVRELDRP